MITLEDGTTPAGANTYVDPLGAWAIDHVAGMLYPGEWATATDEKKEAAIRSATRTLDASFDWEGHKATSGQSLKWPRLGVVVDGYAIGERSIPEALKQATMELAIQLLERNRTSDLATAAPVESIGLGDGALDIKFGASTDPTAKDVPIISEYVAALVRPYGSPITGGNLRMVRIERR